MKEDRSIHLAIDPGSTDSGWVRFRCDPTQPGRIKIVAFGKTANLALRKMMRDWLKNPHGVLAVETPRAQGMSVANELFETAIQIGRFLQTWGGSDWSYLFRGEIKLDICGQARAKDPNVRKALIDMWGGEEAAIGGKKCSRCHGHKHTGKQQKPCGLCGATGWTIPPGPLYGVSKDVWAALAVAVSWAMTRPKKHDLSPSNKSSDPKLSGLAKLTPAEKEALGIK